ncbi:MAG: hypothetical protein NVSMB19_03060 [Vulcanimicrobiaceae bacterium]
MKNRKTFLTALGFSSVSLALGGRGDAEPTAAPSAGPAPSDAPPAAAPAAAKPAGALALAAASAMRRFDPNLSDADVEKIARGIEQNANVGARLDPKEKRLRNGDEPVTSFVVRLS